MTPLQILDFVVRHTAYKSTKAIASIAMTDPGNLHSCLAGKRALPGHIASRVASAVGLRAYNKQEELAVDIEADTIITLEVGASEQTELAAFLNALSDTKRYSWRLLEQQVEPNAGEVFGGIVASFHDSYVIALLTCTTPGEAYQVLDKGLDSGLEGFRLPQAPDQFAFNAGDTTWLRLKAGLISKRVLDKMFLKEQKPSIQDWANMLLQLDQEGVTPAVVSHALRQQR